MVVETRFLERFFVGRKKPGFSEDFVGDTKMVVETRFLGVCK